MQAVVKSVEKPGLSITVPVCRSQSKHVYCWIKVKFLHFAFQNVTSDEDNDREDAAAEETESIQATVRKLSLLK